jgi:hypothetical protein
MTNADKESAVEKDEQQLTKLDQDIDKARQHLKEQTREGEETFIQEGSESRGETDDTIAPPG